MDPTQIQAKKSPIGLRHGIITATMIGTVLYSMYYLTGIIEDIWHFVVDIGD